MKSQLRGRYFDAYLQKMAEKSTQNVSIWVFCFPPRFSKKDLAFFPKTISLRCLTKYLPEDDISPAFRILYANNPFPIPSVGPVHSLYITSVCQSLRILQASESTIHASMETRANSCSCGMERVGSPWACGCRGHRYSRRGTSQCSPFPIPHPLSPPPFPPSYSIISIPFLDVVITHCVVVISLL